jgi:uncharacterized SAM-binding protein YcdF (DUF218 family)
MISRWMIWSLAAPSRWLVLAVVVGAVLLLVNRPRAGRAFILFAAVGFIVFAMLPTARLLAYPLEARFPQPRLPAQVDGIILLSGAERTTVSGAYGEPQVGAEGGRYLAALRLAASHPEARVVFTGGSRAGGMAASQTAVAEAILGSIGLDPGRVLIDDRSRDTCDHPGNVRALARPRDGETWVVVTTAMHVPRVVACFRAAGWPSVLVQPTSYRTVPDASDVFSPTWISNLEIVDDAAHEWLGLLFYRWSGRTREVLPSP